LGAVRVVARQADLVAPGLADPQRLAHDAAGGLRGRTGLGCARVRALVGVDLELVPLAPGAVLVEDPHEHGLVGLLLERDADHPERVGALLERGDPGHVRGGLGDLVRERGDGHRRHGPEPAQGFDGGGGDGDERPARERRDRHHESSGEGDRGEPEHTPTRGERGVHGVRAYAKTSPVPPPPDAVFGVPRGAANSARRTDATRCAAPLHVGGRYALRASRRARLWRGSSTWRASASTQPATSSGATYSASPPPASGRAPRSDATTGMPWRNASITGSPKPSVAEGTATTR